MIPPLPTPDGLPPTLPPVKNFLDRPEFQMVVEQSRRRRLLLWLILVAVLLLATTGGFGGYRVYLAKHRLATHKVATPTQSAQPLPTTVVETQSSASPSPTTMTSGAKATPSNTTTVTTTSSAPTHNVPAPAPKIDPSTPSAIGIPGSTCTQPVQTVSTPAFSPPANSRIYIVASADSYPIGDANCLNETTQNSIASITSSAGTAWSRLAYTTQRDSSVGGFVDVWSTALSSSQANMTITVNFVAPMKAEPNQVSPSGMLKVIVVDNAGASQTVAPATVDQMGSMTATAAATLNNVPANSLSFLAVDYWNSYSTPPAVPAGQFILDNVNNQGENDTWTMSDAPVSSAGPLTLSQTITDNNYPTDNWHAVAWAVTP